MTGGSSPLGLYRLLAEEPLRSEVPWARVHWFMGDDRFVPESDPLSNMGAARRAFLDRVSAPPQNIHPIPIAANDPGDAAHRYEDELKRFYGADRLDPGRPLFDIVLMGLGRDGHTASLFPNSPALAATRELLFLIDSADKRQIVARVFAGEDLPAHRAYAQGDLVWLIVRAAAPEAKK